MAVVGSVAAALLCLGGFGAAVYGAGPGDALYGLRTMLFGEQQAATRDYEVFLAAQTELAEVQQLIDQGQWTAAQDKLEASPRRSRRSMTMSANKNSSISGNSFR